MAHVQIYGPMTRRCCEIISLLRSSFKLFSHFLLPEPDVWALPAERKSAGDRFFRRRFSVSLRSAVAWFFWLLFGVAAED